MHLSFRGRRPRPLWHHPTIAACGIRLREPDVDRSREQAPLFGAFTPVAGRDGAWAVPDVSEDVVAT